MRKKRKEEAGVKDRMKKKKEKYTERRKNSVKKEKFVIGKG